MLSTSYGIMSLFGRSGITELNSKSRTQLRFFSKTFQQFALPTTCQVKNTSYWQEYGLPVLSSKNSQSKRTAFKSSTSVVSGTSERNGFTALKTSLVYFFWLHCRHMIKISMKMTKPIGCQKLSSFLDKSAIPAGSKTQQ